MCFDDERGAYFVFFTTCRSGTTPPLSCSFSSSARARRISACLSDRVTLGSSLVYLTTRYSICKFQQRSPLHLWQAHLVPPKQSVLFFALCAIPDGQQLLRESAQGSGANNPDMCTCIPHSRTCCAFCLASGQSNGVPRALRTGQQCLESNWQCLESNGQCLFNSQ